MSEIPAGMIRLTALPVGEDGAPVWNDEVDAATQRFGSEFLAPFHGRSVAGLGAEISDAASAELEEAVDNLLGLLKALVMLLRR